MPQTRGSRAKQNSTSKPKIQPARGCPRGRPRGRPCGRPTPRAPNQVRGSRSTLATSSSASSTRPGNRDCTNSRRLRVQKNRPVYTEASDLEQCDDDTIDSTLLQRKMSPARPRQKSTNRATGPTSRSSTTDTTDRVSSHAIPSRISMPTNSSLSQIHLVQINLSSPANMRQNPPSQVDPPPLSPSGGVRVEQITSSTPNSDNMRILITEPEPEIKNEVVIVDEFVQMDELAIAKCNYRLKVFAKYRFGAVNEECEIRRFGMKLMGPSIYQQFCEKLQSTFPNLAGQDFTIQWKDCEGDMITVSSREEFEEALRVMRNHKVLEFYVR